MSSRRRPTRRSRAPIGSWPSSTTPTPTPAPRSASRRSAPPTTCWATPRSARSTTRCASTGRCPAASAAGSARPAAATFRMEDVGNLGDLFGGLFGSGGRTRTQRGPQRGADMEAELHLSFHDAVHGVTTSVNVPQEVRCSNCKGQRGRAGHLHAHLPALRRDGKPQRQPGPVLAQHGLPRLPGPRHALRHALPGLPGDGHRAQGALGQGPHPARRGGRPAHPGQGPWRAGAGHGAPRGPLRGGPRGPPPRLRAQRAQPDYDGPDHLPRGRAGHDHHRPHARRQGDAQGAAGHRVGQGDARAGPGRPGRVRSQRRSSRATSW